ncbi:MAG: ABC transporter ATP-binding protein [Pseudomonadales bacterium]|nr:ABC transporter ATP-binding protein [Pseudomonadales bacterium]
MARLFVRTWPYLKPQFLHILCWLALQLTLYTTVGFATLLIDDLLNNKIMLGDPLEPAQAMLLQLDPSYAEGERLSEEQQFAVRDRFVLYVAIGAFISTVLMQICVLHYYYTWIIQRINQRLRVTMVEKAEHLSLRYHSHARTGDAIYRVYQDSATITAIIDTAILDPINMIWKLGFAFFILWLFNPLLGFICLLATVPIILVVAWYTPRLQHFARLARESNSNLTSRIQESFAAIRVVKANQAETTVMRRFDRDSNHALDAALRVRMEMILLWMIVLAMAGTAMFIADYLMAGWTVNEEATWLAGAITLVGMAIWNLGAFQQARGRVGEYFGWGQGLINKWSLMQDMAVGLHRAYHLLDVEPEVTSPRSPVRVPAPIREVAYDDVHFAYDEEAPVLAGVGLTARAGTVTAIVGATGSGKTTLMSLLLRLYDPTKGAVRINGVDIRHMGIDDLRANCAIALQQNVLFAATVADNIGYASRRAAREDIEAAARVACADGFIGEMAAGYDTELGERGGKLSIARAIVRDTPILILDEPTASLDAETEQRLLANLSVWGRERVVFLITHRLSTIRNADQIAFLDHGRIEEIGDHDSLMAIPDGRYRRFVIAETEGVPAGGAQA